MAKVNISLDTDSKECTVNIDGRVIENAQYISIDKSPDSEYKYLYLSINTVEKEDNGITKNVNYTSYGSKTDWDKNLKEEGAEVATSFSPAFIKKDGITKVEEDILEYFS